MKNGFYARMLLLAAFFSSALFLVGCSGEQVEQKNRVKRIYKEEKDGNVSRYTEFRIYYDADFCISKVSRQIRREENGSSVTDSYVDYFYVKGRDTLYVRYGGTMGGGQGASAYGGEYRMPLDGNGRVSSRMDGTGSETWTAVYEDGALAGLKKQSHTDSTVASELSFFWEKGNLSGMRVGENRVDFEYGEAPLVNRMNLDFLQFLLETTYVGHVPLWSIGRMGKADADMPSRMVMNATGNQIVFSYQTDGRNVISISMHSTQTGTDEMWQIEYE